MREITVRPDHILRARHTFVSFHGAVLCLQFVTGLC